LAAIGDKIDVIKWRGDVSRFDLFDLHEIFPGHEFHTFFAHVRYATSGDKKRILEEAHPHVLGGKKIINNNHIIVRDCDAIIVHNGQIDLEQICTKSIPTTNCDTEKLLHFFIENNEFKLANKIPGAYTLAIAEKKREEVVIMRDRLGMRPGVLGRKDGKYGVASESIAFEENGGKTIEDLTPGYAYYLTPEGNYRKSKLAESNKNAFCMFEWQYIMRENSISSDLNIRIHRRKLGRQIAAEFFPEDADFVTYAPRCPEPAAISYSEMTGIPLIKVFYKPRAERSFQGSTKEERAISIKENLYLIPAVRDKIRDKNLIVIEDSIIRGNVLERIRSILFEEAKVKKVYVFSYTPPLCATGKDGVDRGCLFGVDMPPQPNHGDTYIARGRTPEEISRGVGMDVRYLSIEGFLNTFEQSGIKRGDLCTYCLGGEHPFVQLEVKK